MKKEKGLRCFKNAEVAKGKEGNRTHLRQKVQGQKIVLFR